MGNVRNLNSQKRESNCPEYCVSKLYGEWTFTATLVSGSDIEQQPDQGNQFGNAVGSVTINEDCDFTFKGYAQKLYGALANYVDETDDYVKWNSTATVSLSATGHPLD